MLVNRFIYTYVEVDLTVRSGLCGKRHRRFHQIVSGFYRVAGRLEQRDDAGRVRREQKHCGQKQHENGDPNGARVQAHRIPCRKKPISRVFNILKDVNMLIFHSRQCHFQNDRCLGGTSCGEGQNVGNDNINVTSISLTYYDNCDKILCFDFGPNLVVTT